MAAVLCQGVGKACNGVCDCIGAVCTAPFKLCGACCDGFGQCCNESCKLVTNCCSTSFCCYITVATILNLPPIVVGLTDLPNIASGCSGSVWLLIFWLLCVVNIVAAFYMSVAIQRDDSILPQQQQQANHNVSQNATDGAHRMKQLFCYDGWMAVYILVLCGFFGWLMLGGVWFASGTMDDDEDCDGIHGKVGIAYGFGWAFVCVGGCALMSSMCCTVFNRSSGGGGGPAVPVSYTGGSGAAAPAAAPSSSTAPNTNTTYNKPNATSAPPATSQPSAPAAEAEIPVATATIIPETGYGSVDEKNSKAKA